MVRSLGRADLHVHTNHSHDGLSSIAEVLDAAEEARLSLIAITDHDQIEGARQAAELAKRRRIGVIIGEEISTRGGHIIGLFLKQNIPASLSVEATITEIHTQGGIAIIAHPLYRLYIGLPDRRKGVCFGGVTKRSMSRLLAGPAISRPDAVELYNSSLNGRIPHREVERLNRTVWKLPEVGSSDAHRAPTVGTSVTLFSGQSPEALRRAILRGETIAEGSFTPSGEMAKVIGGAAARVIKKQAGRAVVRPLRHLKN